MMCNQQRNLVDANKPKLHNEQMKITIAIAIYKDVKHKFNKLNYKYKNKKWISNSMESWKPKICAL
jgi:hypothetical protein